MFSMPEVAFSAATEYIATAFLVLFFIEVGLFKSNRYNKFYFTMVASHNFFHTYSFKELSSVSVLRRWYLGMQWSYNWNIFGSTWQTKRRRGFAVCWLISWKDKLFKAILIYKCRLWVECRSLTQLTFLINCSRNYTPNNSLLLHNRVNRTSLESRRRIAVDHVLILFLLCVYGLQQ